MVQQEKYEGDRKGGDPIQSHRDRVEGDRKGGDPIQSHRDRVEGDRKGLLPTPPYSRPYNDYDEKLRVHCKGGSGG